MAARESSWSGLGGGGGGGTGPAGPAGAAGSVWFTGAGAPGVVVGAVNGDLYLSTNQGDVYKLIAGVWTYQTNIIGADGDPGATGATGPGVPTGGTTGQMLRKNSSTNYDLGYVSNVVSIGQVSSALKAIGTGGATKTIDWNEGNVQSVTLSANLTFTFTNPVTGAGYVLKITQDTTARTITWPATVKWAGGAAPTLTATSGAIDIVSLLWDGTNYFGNIAKAFA